MARPNQDKIRVNITIDKELNSLLEKRKENKSALINSLLWKFLGLQNNKTLVSNPQTPLPKKCRFRDLNSGPPDYERDEIREEEIRDKSLNNFNLFSVYKTHQNKFIEWVGSKYSQKYFDEVNSALNKIFKEERENINQIREYILETKEVAQRSSSIALRVFFNFCEHNELLRIEQLIFFRNKIKIKVNKNIDPYVPNKTKVLETLEFIKKKYPQYEYIYRMLLESGCRITELKHFLENYSKKNLELWDDNIIIYSNFYLRGQKSSYYLFFTKQTHNKLLSSGLQERNIEHLKDIIKHNGLLPLKYLRKYQFTLMIENNISFEIANFIQGRTSQNIGFNHYLSKKIIAVREYQKIIKFFF